MSQPVLFEIGAVIFLTVLTAVFWYGLALFQDWQDRDDTHADPSVQPELANRERPFDDATASDATANVIGPDGTADYALAIDIRTRADAA